ncbi:hypothetical protein JYT28_01775, partial [Desulfobulbus sp. AH-315-M07]|nr:hypothetical protein [Desulfobulbus sp. AH-315-M07]
MKSRVFLFCFACTVVACSDDVVPPPRVEILSYGDTHIELDDAAHLDLFIGAEKLLSFDAASWQLGVQAVVDDDTVYDPYRLFDPSPLYTFPDELAFVSPSSATFGAVDETSAMLLLDYGAGLSAELRVEAIATGRFSLRLLPTAGVERVAYIRVRPVADASEGFYGLGEYFDDVNHRGKVRAMQLEVGGLNSPALESQYNEAHVPVPMVVGTRGWGMFVESPFPGVFAVAVDDDQRVDAAFGTGTFSAQGLTVHLYAADHPLDVTKHYFETTGYPKLPARWALGPWVWRDENEDQAQVEADLDAIRDLDLATNGYWIDRPYASAVNTFDFESQKFPDPPAMFSKMKSLGFRAALWHTPYLDEEHPATAELLAHADSEGYYPTEFGPKLNAWGTPLDLTNSAAVSWWREQLADYVALG